MLWCIMDIDKITNKTVRTELGGVLLTTRIQLHLHHQSFN